MAVQPPSDPDQGPPADPEMPEPIPAATPSVSVVIPAYNRAATIRLAIESVLRQSYADFELIVVDDGSSDGTQGVVAAIEDPRLRLVETPRNMGASAARNLGTREARAPWVAFQDSDDEWLPLKLEKQMARLKALGGDYVAVYCGMLVIGTPDGTAATGVRPRIAYVPDPGVAVVEGDILTTLMQTSVVSTQTLVVRRDRMLEIGGFDESFRALIDRECLLRLAPLGPIACVDEPLVLQRFSENSITRDNALRLRSQARIVEKHHDLYAGHPELLAGQYYAIAGGHRRLGEYAEARAALARARALQPTNPRLWAMTAYLALHGRGA